MREAKRIDPEARGSVCAVKRAHVIGATDQRTTSGPADPILRAKAEDMTAPSTYAKLKKALDQRALSRHDNALACSKSLIGEGGGERAGQSNPEHDGHGSDFLGSPAGRPASFAR
jgi:hypothetical protein